MINAPYEEEFVFQDGRRAKNLLELSVVLEGINRQDFERFVNPGKNDFANWVEYVLMDKQLASSLRSTISFEKTRELLDNKLAVENNSLSSINSVNGNYSKKRILFNIFKHEPKNAVVEIKVPIKKLPEPEHHVIQMIPEQKVSETTVDNKIIDNKIIEQPKRKWFMKKDVRENAEQKNITQGSTEKKDFAAKKDNSLKRWYEFKRREQKERKESEHKVRYSDRNFGGDSSPESIFWTVIYGLLILLIIALIVYKFILKL
jgi:hypothetical protein